jgi:hypothetical protein
MRNSISGTALLSIIASIFNLSASSQVIKASKVPKTVKSKIYSLYPAVTKIIWTQEKENFEAEFNNKGLTTSILIDKLGKLIESEVSIAPSTLPEDVLKSVKASFPGKRIAEAAIIDTDGIKTYEAEVEGIDHIYTVDGKLVKSVKD